MDRIAFDPVVYASGKAMSASGLKEMLRLQQSPSGSKNTLTFIDCGSATRPTASGLESLSG
ncbi:hypothetical protein Q31b_18270 [Novipirellula aureliae]|uniref:Uncharacterized protein n=1 Tax=Novipirellula aureliae TaxID=2527966 RepID=A0A5C6E994_9BACT|nr:hypothetical protein Q31b_18270 [Novipirellula aureliae]